MAWVWLVGFKRNTIEDLNRFDGRQLVVVVDWLQKTRGNEDSIASMQKDDHQWIPT